MNSAHASLLQWLQENKYILSISSPTHSDLNWCIWIGGSSPIIGSGESYEAACYDLLQQLKR